MLEKKNTRPKFENCLIYLFFLPFFDDIIFFRVSGFQTFPGKKKTTCIFFVDKCGKKTKYSQIEWVSEVQTFPGKKIRYLCPTWPKFKTHKKMFRQLLNIIYKYMYIAFNIDIQKKKTIEVVKWIQVISRVLPRIKQDFKKIPILGYKVKVSKLKTISRTEY